MGVRHIAPTSFGPPSVYPSGQGGDGTLVDQRTLPKVPRWGTLSIPHPVNSPFLTLRRSQGREGGQMLDGSREQNDGRLADG